MSNVTTSSSTILNTFVKEYAGTYKYTTTVRHKGTVIAFAMDSQQQIFYSILNLNAANDDSVDSSSDKSPIDKNYWVNPVPLNFPHEIAEVGFGVADQTLLPVYRVGNATPERPGTNLAPYDKDLFLSTTARFTADAPFQVLTDGEYIYLFRQAIADPATYAIVEQQQAARRKMLFISPEGQLAVSRDGINLGFVNKAGDWVPVSSATPVLNATLLVDRFVLSGTHLQTKMEVRFQRSRTKTRPQSRKDSLGAKDLDGNNFLEPTQELKFIGNLTEGRFTALLLPTQLQEIQRWQIFVHNRQTQLIDSYDVERSPDGLFNTRGSQIYTCPDHPEVFALKAGTCVEPSLTDPSQLCNKTLIPRVVTEGYAESALQTRTAEALDAEGAALESSGHAPGYSPEGRRVILSEPHIVLAAGVKLGQAFTQEAWILPANFGTKPQALITSKGHTEDSLESSRRDPNACPSIWIEAGSRVRIGLGDGTHWREIVTQSILTPNAWNHLAVTFDGTYRVYVNGRLRWKANATQIYVQGIRKEVMDAEGTLQPKLEPLKGITLPDGAIATFGAAHHSFTGRLDEIRLWSRARSAQELQADLHQRLVGQEFKLAGYWRFDEAMGNVVYDQTDHKMPGTLQSDVQWQAPGATFSLNGWAWVASDAPVGECLGVSRSSFQIWSNNATGQMEPRSVTSGMTALLYYQQEPVASGYANEKKPLKRNARVMLAVATRSASGDKDEIATLDFGVSGAGKLAQIPDVVPLSVIHRPGDDGQSINQKLDQVSSLQNQTRILNEEIINLTEWIDRLTPTVAILNGAIANPSAPSAPITDPALASLNAKLKALQAASDEVTRKQQQLDELTQKVPQASATFYEDERFRGDALGMSLGFWNQDLLGAFAGKISSLKVPPQLWVTLYENADRMGRSAFCFADQTSLASAGFNDLTHSIEIAENPDYTNPAKNQLQVAQRTFDQKMAEVMQERDTLQDRINLYGQEKQEKITQRTTFQSLLNSIQSTITNGIEVPMQLVHTDPFGLTLSGGLLGFAWTQDTPLLFDSATGSLALYFRGLADQFFVTYYTTLTERAEYSLTDEKGSDRVICYARSTDLEMDQIVIATSGSQTLETCTVTITGVGIEEVWRNVPRMPDRFAAVLNGLAGQREFVGYATLTVQAGAARLEFSDAAVGVKRSLPSGATLMVGQTRVTVKEAMQKGAVQVAIEAASESSQKLPVFFLEYDYASHASTTKVPNDLYNGSLLVRAAVHPDAVMSDRVQVGQRVTSGSTLTCKWTAAAPGRTLVFNGVRDYAQLGNSAAPATPAQLKALEAANDVTIEAWVRPNQVRDKARILQHYSSEGANYALGLEAKERLSALEFTGRNAIDLGAGVKIGSQFTQEVWIYPTPEDDSYYGILGNPDQDANRRSPSIWVVQKTHIHAGFGSGSAWNAFTSQSVLTLNSWNHVALTFDGVWYRL